ncbi:MAG: hypothetical protein RUMPE_01175 [Eubacteriales bacterium SKADARSKE-1]|nr:hypothetical protein [Eubacteriales bacterium SKADARSKE-1]
MTVDINFLKRKKIFSSATYNKMRYIYMVLFILAVFTRVLMPIATHESQKVNAAVFSAVALFGVAVLVVDFFCDRIMFLGKNYIFLALFIISTVVSSILNIKYGFAGNIRNLIWLSVSFFILYPIDIKRTKNDIYKEIKFISNILIVVWFLAVTASLFMFLLDIGYYIYIYPDSFARLGFIESRLFGIFEDPNFAATTSVLVIMFSIWNIKVSKRKVFNIFYIINIAFQLFYLVLSGSRTAEISLLFSLLIFSYFTLRYKFSDINLHKALKEFCFAFLGLALCCVLFFTMNLIKTGLSYLPPIISSQMSTTQGHQDRIRPVVTEREDLKDNSDVSSCRVKIWESAFELFKSKPIFGTSPRNMREYAKSAFPNGFIAQRSYAVHNIYLDILTSTGIVGFVIIAIFFIKYLIYVFKYLFLYKRNNYFMVLFCLTVVAEIAVSAASLSEIFFVNTIGVLFFWLCLGYSVHFIRLDSLELNKQ